MNSPQPTAAGKSSYDLIDTARFWEVLAVAPGMTVLDLACGNGRYTLPLRDKVRPDGRVIALDLWAEGIEQLRAAARNSPHDIPIETHVADAAETIPIASDSIDLCLMATVLHDFAEDDSDAKVLAEVARVLKPAGILSIVEFIKQDGPPGPPKAVRLSLQEVSIRLLPLGLIRFGAVVELGPHTYFAQFRALRRSAGPR
jgi:ubiquinone/menaquinone biosynthesis C-methylase UbiE